MKRLFSWLYRHRYPYISLIAINISRKQLLHNLHEFMRIAPNGRVAPVLKSNAYGHGLIEVARILERERIKQVKTRRGGIPFFIIDSYFEAVTLRSNGIQTPLLIIGYTRPETIAQSRLKNVMFTITTIDTLKQITSYQSPIFDFRSRKISINLKIDTGMHRQGMLPGDIDQIDHFIDINPSIVIKGICSHFSDADNQDSSFTESQIHKWNKIVHHLTSEYSSIEYIHISNTDGHRFIKESHANLSRLGIGLYGLTDGGKFAPRLHLKPVMNMQTIITGIKKITRDDTVGYGNTFKAEKEMTIANIPVGYYEGIDRRLSNSGTILVGNERIPCPIVGRVSMNITTIDVSNVLKVSIGTPVTVISDNAQDKNSIIEMAQKCNTIPYEIAVKIPSHLKKVVVA
ncbi:MAG: alanine racemase [Patescibacteria group bacterium]